MAVEQGETAVGPHSETTLYTEKRTVAFEKQIDSSSRVCKSMLKEEAICAVAVWFLLDNDT